MADTGFAFPGTAVNDATVGTIDWVDVIGSDTLIVCVSADGGGMVHPTGVRLSGAVTENSVKLVIGGSVAGDEKSTSATFATGVKTYGGASDLWGLTPSVAQVNASGFGFAISIVGNGGTSKYLMVTNFGFSVPAGSTINGIEVTNDIENPAGSPRWDYIQIKVYYTEAGGNAVSVGYIGGAPSGLVVTQV